LQAVNDHCHPHSDQGLKSGIEALHEVHEATGIKILFPHVSNGDEKEGDVNPGHLISFSFCHRWLIGGDQWSKEMSARRLTG